MSHFQSLRLFLGLFFALGLFAAGCESKKVSVGNMWVRLPMKGKRVTAGYLSLVNQSSKKLVLKSASSPDFGRIEIHTMQIEGDVMKMQKIDTIEIAPGGRVELKPHGKHLMMFDPKRQLKKGDTVHVTLHFKNNPDISLPLTVKKDY